MSLNCRSIISHFEHWVSRDAYDEFLDYIERADSGDEEGFDEGLVKTIPTGRKEKAFINRVIDTAIKVSEPYAFKFGERLTEEKYPDLLKVAFYIIAKKERAYKDLHRDDRDDFESAIAKITENLEEGYDIMDDEEGGRSRRRSSGRRRRRDDDDDRGSRRRRSRRRDDEDDYDDDDDDDYDDDRGSRRRRSSSRRERYEDDRGSRRRSTGRRRRRRDDDDDYDDRGRGRSRRSVSDDYKVRGRLGDAITNTSRRRSRYDDDYDDGTTNRRKRPTLAMRYAKKQPPKEEFVVEEPEWEPTLSAHDHRVEREERKERERIAREEREARKDREYEEQLARERELKESLIRHRAKQSGVAVEDMREAMEDTEEKNRLAEERDKARASTREKRRSLSRMTPEERAEYRRERERELAEEEASMQVIEIPIDDNDDISKPFQSAKARAAEEVAQLAEVADEEEEEEDYDEDEYTNGVELEENELDPIWNGTDPVLYSDINFRNIIQYHNGVKYRAHDDFGFFYKVPEFGLTVKNTKDFAIDAVTHAKKHGLGQDEKNLFNYVEAWRIMYLCWNNIPFWFMEERTIARSLHLTNRADNPEIELPTASGIRDIEKLPMHFPLGCDPSSMEEKLRESKLSSFANIGLTKRKDLMDLGYDVNDEDLIMSRPIMPFCETLNFVYDAKRFRLEWVINDLGYRQQISRRLSEVDISDHKIPRVGNSKVEGVKQPQLRYVKALADKKRVTVTEANAELENRISAYERLMLEWERENGDKDVSDQAPQPSDPTNDISYNDQTVLVDKDFTGASIDDIIEQARAYVQSQPVVCDHNGPLEVDGTVTSQLYRYSNNQFVTGVMKALKVFTKDHEPAFVGMYNMMDYYNALDAARKDVAGAITGAINNRLTDIVNMILRNILNTQYYIEDFFDEYKEMMDDLKATSPDIAEAFELTVQNRPELFKFITPGGEGNECCIMNYQRYRIVMMPLTLATLCGATDAPRRNRPPAFTVSKAMYPELADALSVASENTPDDATGTIVVFDGNLRYRLFVPMYSARLKKYMGTDLYTMVRSQ